MREVRIPAYRKDQSALEISANAPMATTNCAPYFRASLPDNSSGVPQAARFPLLIRSERGSFPAVKMEYAQRMRCGREIERSARDVEITPDGKISGGRVEAGSSDAAAGAARGT